ncbi:MAG: insulinase family protein [Acidobacteriota bacterium]|nr:insulinase family protein [Acidobacteriota bacterium]
MVRKLFLAAVVTGFVLAAQTLPAGVQKLTSVEGITEYSFPNGLRVLLFPDASKPKLTVNITYLVGSRHEGYGETGMAHLMEHMLFLRTKGGKDVKKELTDHGAFWNGTTWYDRTNYFETVTASDDNLRWAINLEAERMRNMRIEKPLLDTEMTVVRNEFEMGENSPMNTLYQRTLEAAYTFHNYGKSTIGNRSDIENVPIERLAAFYQKYYQPDNAILTIAGQFDGAKALAIAAETLGAIPRPQRALEKTYTVEPVQDGERTVTVRRVGDQQAIIVVYHTTAATHPDTAALEVLSTVLGDTPSGRLHKALVENNKAVNSGADQQELHDPGFFMVDVLLKQDQSLESAREITMKTIEGVVKEPPSKEEVERAKARILKQIDLNMTNSERIGVTLSEYAASGDWRLLYLLRDRIKGVTPQDVARVAKSYLKDSNRTTGMFIPTKNPDRAEIPAAPDAAVALKDYKGGALIAEGEAFTPTPANIESRVVRGRLPNGVRMSVLSKKTRGGVVTARVRLDFGDEKSVFGKAAVGQLTAAMLMRGTKNKTRQQIQDESDRLKARIGVTGSATDAVASIETTEANLPDALRLAAEVLREPSFPDTEFEQLKRQRIAQIESSKSEPLALGQMELQRRLHPYPRGHVRYVGTPDEQIADIQKVTLDEVKAFYTQFYGASNGKFVVSGQANAPQLQKLAADLFGNWKSPGPFTRVPLGYQKVEPADRKIETPDKQNALFVAGLNAKMSDEDPDYPAMVIANFIFGGSGGSRLFKRIRDKEGLSYGIGSNFSAPTKDDGANFVVFGISNPLNSPKVEASFKDELARTVKDGFTADEVASAKKSWQEEQTVSRSQDQALLGELMACERFDRTMKWDEAMEAKVAALTPDQVTAAFRRHVDPGALVYVKAGDFKKAGVYQQ